MTTFSFANSVLLNAAVAAAMAILVWTVAMVPFIRRRPGLRHCLWVIVLLKLVTPPLVEFSILPNWSASEPTPLTHPRAIPLDQLSLASPSNSKSIVASQPLSASELAIDWIFVLVSGAAIGTLGVVFWAVVQVWRLRRALRHGAANDDRLNRIAAVAGKAMGVASPPPVCVVAANVSPLLWMRWSGPLVVVPRRLSDELSDEQLCYVIAHEIAHYLRRDHRTNLLSLLVAAACWWNPVVWWARRELRIAQEACCDALVISRSFASRRKYAETLFQALEFLQAERSLQPALASGFGNKSSTKGRFEMIANPLVNHRLAWWGYPVVLAALALLPCLPSFTQAQKPTQQNEKPSRASKAFGSEFRRAWLDAEGVVPAENQVAVAALCWAVKEQMRDKPFTPWLSEKRIQVDWPVDERFERFAALDLYGVLPQGITDDHLRRAWMDLYGLPLTDKEKERAALSWIKLRQNATGKNNKR